MIRNVFVKPNEQNRACSSYAMARKRRMKSKVYCADFVVSAVVDELVVLVLLMLEGMGMKPRVRRTS